MIRTAIIGAALLAFTVSFDEIVISYFLTGTWMTLPVYRRCIHLPSSC